MKVKRFLVLTFLSVFLTSCGGMLLPVASEWNRDQVTSAKVVQLVNRERARRGLVAVRGDEGLQRMAERHAGDLAARVDPTRRRPSRETAHRGFSQRARGAAEQGYLVLSEVVMIGYAGNLNAVAERTIAGWLNSSSHRSAILNDDRRIMGVSTRITGDGRYFVVGLLSNGRPRAR